MSDHSGGEPSASRLESEVSWNAIIESEEVKNKSTVNSETSKSNATLQNGNSSAIWSKVTGTGLESSKVKNVLEVVLEKDSRGSFVVSETDCARFLSKLGFDMRPGIQVEGVQICPNGRGVLFITLKDNIDITKYCRYEIVDVNTTGVRATLIKPAGKRESVVTLKGVHPNTRDEVIHY